MAGRMHITAANRQDFQPRADCGAPLYRPASMGAPQGVLRCPPCGFRRQDARRPTGSAHR